MVWDYLHKITGRVLWRFQREIQESVLILADLSYAVIRTESRGFQVKRKLGDFTGRIGDSLQIPRDLSYRESVLTLTGSRELYIENYKCIRQYQDTCIILLSRQNKIKIEGTKLMIVYYTDVEMKITGNICNILFL